MAELLSMIILWIEHIQRIYHPRLWPKYLGIVFPEYVQGYDWNQIDNGRLVGGLEHFLFFHILFIVIPID